VRDANYLKYIGSAAWKAKRQQYFALYGKKCQVCNSRQNIKIHHRTYARFGRELLVDILALCQQHHLEVHKFHRKVGGNIEDATARYLYIKRKKSK
jgi:5-methylcytosine-specific restriction endonuclease McrA